ncbi:MAG: xanthine dehydrogenase family protein subunit M [Chloroflexi bacterium]|nr:xanthine dehydrogenase family protein subunit M [Chloroflexota bacterium]
MKPASFDYFAPKSIDEALALLAEYGYDAKPLAGGQSLVPTMNFRLAQPAVLVDLNGIDELFFIRESGDGLRIGAMTRQRTVERSPLVRERAPLIHETMPHIAHPQIRNRGTFGGSLAHADPASELPVLAVTLNARMRVQSSQGERWVDAKNFYLDLFATDLQADELLVEIAIPDLPTATGWAFDEMARRHGDYAMAGAAATVTLAADGSVAATRLVYLSVGDYPTEAFQSEAALIGEQPTPEALRAAAEIAASQDIDPIGDIHASADYRRHLARVLAERVLARALERAKER